MFDPGLGSTTDSANGRDQNFFTEPTISRKAGGLDFQPSVALASARLANGTVFE
jgi:hypothetical protein